MIYFRIPAKRKRLNQKIQEFPHLSLSTLFSLDTEKLQLSFPLPKVALKGFSSGGSGLGADHAFAGVLSHSETWAGGLGKNIRRGFLKRL